MTYDHDPVVDLVWERHGRLWRCRTVFVSGLVSALSAPLEPEPVLRCARPFAPGHGVFRAPGDPTTLLVVGDDEVSGFCDAAKPKPDDEQVVEAMYDPDWMGCLIIGVVLTVPETTHLYHVSRLFQPNINPKSLEIT